MEHKIKNSKHIFSFGQSLFDKQLKQTTIKEIYNIITSSEKLKSSTLSVRKLFGTDQYGKEKLNLPSSIFSGIFKERKIIGLQSLSGLISIDIDKRDDISELKEKLKELSFVHLLYTTPSGVGLKVVIKIAISSLEQFQNYFSAIEQFFIEEYMVEIDKACKDISRASLVCYDQGVYYNENSEELTIEFIKKWNKQIDKTIKKTKATNKISKANLSSDRKRAIRDKVLSEMHSRIDNAKDGEKHNVLLKQANYIGNHVYHEILNLDTATKELISAISRRDIESQVDAKKTIINGLKYGIDNAPSAKELGFTKQPIFWNIYINNKGEASLALSYSKMYKFLNHNGFYLYQKDSNYLFIKVVDNIIYQVGKVEIIRFVMEFINKQPFNIHPKITRGTLEEVFRKKMNVLFSDNQLHTFTALSPKFIRDKENICYCFFKNGILEITSKGYKLKAYSEIDGHVWNTQILDRDFIDLNLTFDQVIKQSEFAQFITAISGNKESEDLKRLHSIYSVLGYLLSRYKDPRLSRSVIFCDEQISDACMGSTGKGITLKSLSYFRNVVMIDGKSLNGNSQFMYQRVNLDTDIIVFEDVLKKFDFEKLFSIITEGIGVEKKGKDRFYIPYSESPKIMITTNYTIKGEGSSHERRRVEYEFSQHYNKYNTPYNELGHNLYDDWTDEQWQLFNVFMMNCVQFYLQHGLIMPPSINIGYRKLLQNTNEDFIRFMDKQKKSLIDNDINKRHIFSNFKEAYSEFKGFHWFNQRLFNRWLRLYGECNNYKVSERVSNNNQLIRFEIVKN